MSQKLVTFSASLISIADNEFKIKSLYSNDLILNIAVKSKEAFQKLKFLESPTPKTFVFRDFSSINEKE